MGDVRACIFFFRSNLQPIEQQTYKNLSAKKMKKTYKIICIYRKNDIPLSSDSGKKPERLTNLFTY